MLLCWLMTMFFGRWVHESFYFVFICFCYFDDFVQQKSKISLMTMILWIYCWSETSISVVGKFCVIKFWNEIEIQKKWNRLNLIQKWNFHWATSHRQRFALSWTCFPDRFVEFELKWIASAVAKCRLNYRNISLMIRQILQLSIIKIIR